MTNRTPSYRLHRPSGQAVVTLNSQDIYLGKWNQPTSLAEYDRVMAEWLANGRQNHDQPGHARALMITELIVAFWKYAETRYTPEGRELDNFRLSLEPLKELYGSAMADDFGPRSLKLVQRQMVERGWCRNVVNRRLTRIKTMFRWAESEELIRAGTWHALQTVRGLPKGMPGVRESPRIEPAFWNDLAPVLPFCCKAVASMLQIQWWSGMRSCEVRLMRAADIDRSDPACWIYRPMKHKNDWRQGDPGRLVPLGPACQKILREWLAGEDTQGYLFQPRRAVAERNAKRRRERRTPWTPSQLKRRRKRNPKRAAGDHYTASSYARAVARACAKAGVRFRPYGLRHGCKMRIESAEGADAARTVLGQRSIQATQHYGRLDTRKAVEVMARLG